MEKLEALKKQLRALQDEKERYIADNYCGIKDNAVEWEESNDYCIELNEQISEVENEIDLMEDYLYEKYCWGQE